MWHNFYWRKTPGLSVSNNLTINEAVVSVFKVFYCFRKSANNAFIDHLL